MGEVGGGDEPGDQPQASTAALTSPPDLACTPASYGGHDYWFCPGVFSWANARSKCQSIGFDLVSIESSAENQFLLSNLLVNVWIGASDSATEGQWRWSSTGQHFWQGGAGGGAVGGAYRNWGLLQPDNFLNQDCGVFLGGLGLGKWSDESCSTARIGARMMQRRSRPVIAVAPMRLRRTALPATTGSVPGARSATERACVVARRTAMHRTRNASCTCARARRTGSATTIAPMPTRTNAAKRWA